MDKETYGVKVTTVRYYAQGTCVLILVNTFYNLADQFSCPDYRSFKCENGVCISSGSVCDGYNDCRDGSDEVDCGTVLEIKILKVWL